MSLPPATKLGQGYVFTGVCHSVNGGGEYLTRYTPQTRYIPRDQVHPPDQVPPRTRYTPPWDQEHPPRPGTPPGPGTHLPSPPGPGTPHTRYIPWDQVHPPGTRYISRARYTPLGPGTPPSRHRECWEIRSTRGRYASYWNAFLFKFSNYIDLNDMKLNNNVSFSQSVSSQCNRRFRYRCKIDQKYNTCTSDL